MKALVTLVLVFTSNPTNPRYSWPLIFGLTKLNCCSCYFARFFNMWNNHRVHSYKVKALDTLVQIFTIDTTKHGP